MDDFEKYLEELDGQEVMQVLTGASLADKKPAHPVSLERAGKFVEATVGKKKANVFLFLIPAIAIAAGLAVAVFLWTGKGDGALEDGTLAEVTVPTDPSTSAPQVAGTEETPAQVSDKPKTTPAPFEKEEVVLEIQQDESVHAAETEVRTFALLKPDKPIYRIRVVNEDKFFSFRWNPEGIDSLVLILKDVDDNILKKETLVGVDHFDVNAGWALVNGTILWTVLAKYDDGAEASCSGRLIFEKAL